LYLGYIRSIVHGCKSRIKPCVTKASASPERDWRTNGPRIFPSNSGCLGASLA
jgi:hypothetical protein